MVEVVPYQAVINIRLQVRGILSRQFPAIVDIGHSHNLSIREDQLLDWAGAKPDDLKAIGRIKVSGRDVILRRAEIVLCRNSPGTREFTDQPTYPLTTFGGITVLPTTDPLAPRLPLLGMRAIVRDGLRLVVDGKRKQITIRKPWF
jgi:hypothetical protein